MKRSNALTLWAAVLGLLLVVVCAALLVRRDLSLDVEEIALLVLVAWGAAAAAILATAPLAAKETLTVWLVALALWVGVRRCDPGMVEAGRVILVAGALFIAFGVALEFQGLGLPLAGGLLENPNVAAALELPAHEGPEATRAGEGQEDHSEVARRQLRALVPVAQLLVRPGGPGVMVGVAG